MEYVLLILLIILIILSFLNLMKKNDDKDLVERLGKL